jgi:O-antigen ligase
MRGRSAHWYDDPFRLGVVLLIVVTLSKFGGYFAILRAVRPALILFVFCVGYAFLQPKKIILTNLRHSVAVRLLVAIWVVAVCSVAFGISIGHAGQFIIDDFSKTLAITFLILVSIRDVSDLRRLTWAFVFAVILLAFLSIFVVGISKVSIGVTYDANDVGVFMVMTIPLALLFVQSAATKREALVAIFGIALIAATLVKSQSRGAFIGALVVSVALLLMPGVAVGRRLLFVAAATLTMVVAAPTGYWTSMQSILADPKADYNWDAVNGRRNVARRGIGYMYTYPVFGVGIDNFRMAEGTISEKALNLVPGEGIRWSAPHNSFIQAGAETGVPGLLLWTSLVMANVMIPLRLARRIPKAWRKGTPDQRFLWFATVYLPITQVGFAVTAFFVSFAWSEPLYFLSALVAGLAIVGTRELSPITAATGGPGFRSRRAHSLRDFISQPPAAGSNPIA